MSAVHENLIVVDTSSITIMTGTVTMDGSETYLGKNGYTLPKECRATNGTKYFMDRSVLNKLQACRNRLVKFLESVSIRYLGGYAAPISKRSEVLEMIKVEKDEFEKIKQQELLAHYDQWVDKWCSQFPDIASQLKASAPTLEKVRDRNQFAVNVFQVRPLEGDEAIEADKQMGETLFREVNRDARNLFNSSFRGKTECTKKAIFCIERIAKKLQGLSFLDARALPLYTEVFARLAKLPKHGPYKDADFTEVSNIVLRLAMEVDLNYEKGIVDKAAADGINLVNTPVEPLVLTCGVEDEVETEAEEPTTPVEPTEEEKSSDDGQTDLFADLDAICEATKPSNVQKEVKEEIVLPSQSADEEDDYFSDQFA